MKDNFSTYDWNNMSPANIIDCAYDFSMSRTNNNRLYHCTAWVHDFGHIVYLESYVTIVAYFDKESNTIYVNGRYSSTTYQHVRKFRNWCWEHYCNARELHSWDIKEVNLERVNWFK